MNWRDKKFLVFGTGISGIAAAELLQKEKIDFVVYEGNETQTEEEIRSKSAALAKAPVYLGPFPDELCARIHVAVLSPGVPADLPAVKRMEEAGVQIWGEIELAYVFSKGRVLAVTGTNGKTTTTTLLGEIMRNAYGDVQVVGNIGIPYTRIAPVIKKDTVVVAEISSFQLETVHTFCPEVSAILNITPDHLNRHHTMEAYIEAKERIALNQTKEQTCVLNYEDNILREFGERLNINVLFFSSLRKLEKGIYLDGDDICFADGNTVSKVCSTKELAIFGRHNYENVMAAAAMALSFGVAMEKIHEVLVRFQAVAHRIEYVAEKRGVRFYNDSKGTNPDAAIQAVRAMQQPTLLIGGGYDKGSEYKEWIRAFEGKVKKLVLLGQTKDKIAQTACELGFNKEDIILVESLKEAVEACYTNAKSGDAVLLSPACASWGMFQNYEERGNLFKEMVNKLKE